METSELNVIDADVSTANNVNNAIETEAEKNEQEQEQEQAQNQEPETQTVSSTLIEYTEIDDPCVALTIIGENKLTDAEVFVRRSLKFSIKAFFSTLILTIMKMFI